MKWVERSCLVAHLVVMRSFLACSTLLPPGAEPAPGLDSEGIQRGLLELLVQGTAYQHLPWVLQALAREKIQLRPQVASHCQKLWVWHQRQRGRLLAVFSGEDWGTAADEICTTRPVEQHLAHLDLVSETALVQG